jgi:GWxTD domain-containing protein
MKPLLPNSLSALPLWGLFYAASIMTQDGRTEGTLAAKQEINSAGRSFPCFESQDSEQNKQREKEVIAALPAIARFWLTEDAAYIISPEERCVFLHLSTDQDRDHFTDQFWSRRAPNPRAQDNIFKRRHYERIVFANEQFGGQTPGWRTDRGRVYVIFGQPDSIEHPSAGPSEDRQYVREVWHYNNIDAIGQNVGFEFIDPTGSGDYRLSGPPEMKEKLTPIPPYYVGRVSQGGGATQSAKTIEIHIGPAPTPLVEFKDLEAMVVSRIVREQVHFVHRTAFSRATDATTYTKILISIPSRAAEVSNKSASLPRRYAVFGRISRPSGWVVDTFERTISFEGNGDSERSQPNCQFQVPIEPGIHRLSIVVKDLSDGRTGTLYTDLDVPPYERVQGTN